MKICTCCITTSGNQINKGGSLSDIGCSYLKLIHEHGHLANINKSHSNPSEEESDFHEIRTIFKAENAPNVGNSSRFSPCLPSSLADNLPNSKPHNFHCSNKIQMNIKSGDKKQKQALSNSSNSTKKLSHSAFSEIIRPTSEQAVRTTYRKSSSNIFHSRDSTSAAVRNPRRKLSSVSKRNSRHKIVDGEKWTSDDSDASVDTSGFGNYLSNLSACPSLENCNVKATHRKPRKFLPKEIRSSREKCNDYLNSNFSSTNHFSKTAIGKEEPRILIDFNSSSSDVDNSEKDRARRFYSDDSLDESGKNICTNIFSNGRIVHSSSNADKFTCQSPSNYGIRKHPVVLSEELEILRRQLFLKELELHDSLKTNVKSTSGFSRISEMHDSHHPREIGTYEGTLKSPSIKSNGTYDVTADSPIAFDGAVSYCHPNYFRNCNHPLSFLSPEPQILSENSVTDSNFTKSNQNYSSKNRHDINLSTQSDLQNRLKLENCSCSTNMMSQPVQSMLKYFHPAKYSSPHSSFSNSRCSLASDSTNNEQNRLSRLSLTSQFWSKKQLNRDRGVTYTGFWNTTRNIGAFNRFNHPRITQSSRDSSHGATPFGCTGFFIPATKMKSLRRKSDPFVNNCSKKTLDLMRSMQIPSSPGSHLSYQYLSRIMKLENDLKIIPERLPIYSKMLKSFKMHESR